MPQNSPVPTATLEFDLTQLIVGKDTDIRQGLSAVALENQHLWLACDEGCRLERLTRTGSESVFSAHRVFPLAELLTLPADAKEEADIEGLDVDGGWLWFVGSHSIKRKKPKKNDPPSEIAGKLALTERDGNRHLLGRIPLKDGELRRESGGRQSAAIPTSPTSSALLDAVRSQNDPHLIPFVDIPGKDNGLDIEGFAVRGTRAFVGLRGPVLREWCCVLELKLEADGNLLRLEPLDGSVPYRKHFLKLGGLGVRDLLILDDDIYILAGPTMTHDGPHQIWRWKNGAKKGRVASIPDAKLLLTLPQSEGVDRAEGFTAFDQSGGTTSVLVVFDTPAEATRLKGKSSVLADLYRLP